MCPHVPAGGNPTIKLGVVARSQSNQNSIKTNSEVQSQWQNPSDILSLLLLIGGDVIQQAIAQLAGDPSLPTPVVFSFGWVAYTFTALLSVVGDNRLTPIAPDVPSIVVNANSGHARTNQSWMLGRILRDYEHYWMPPAARREFLNMLEKAQRPKAGLCISVFEADPKGRSGRPTRDRLWYAGYVVAFVQIVVAAIPWIIWQEWEIFTITLCGTILSFISASLPQWSSERYSCQKNSNATFILARGNGAQHAIVIQGNGCGLQLEDLAGATAANVKSWTTRPAIIVISCLWVALLITVSGVKENTWFLVAVGAIGMIFTVVVAGAPRKPEAFGVPLVYKSVHAEPRVMEAIKKIEQHYPGVGQSLVNVFFPGGICGKDASWWAQAKEPLDKAQKEGAKKEDQQSAQK